MTFPRILTSIFLFYNHMISVSFTCMKKWITTFVFVVTTVVLKAQQTVEAAREEIPEDGSWFSSASKWTMVYVFSAIIIIIVLRTFRNKPEI